MIPNTHTHTPTHSSFHFKTSDHRQRNPNRNLRSPAAKYRSLKMQGSALILSSPSAASPLLCRRHIFSPRSNLNLSATAPIRDPNLLSFASNHNQFSPLLMHRRSNVVVVVKATDGSAAAVPLPPEDKPAATDAGGGVLQTLQLGSLFGLWYLFNIYFNIYNKQVLKVYSYPMTMTTAQFAVGTVIVLLMWGTNLHKRPKISAQQLIAILPLAMVHTMGNLFTNMSLGKVAVSFTHTIKAMEPFFSVLLSALFLGEMPTGWVVASLLPIVGGVALASVSEASFNWAGFWSAMASNVTFQSRNVLSKKLMIKKEESLDNINLFSIITIMSLFLLAPVTIFVEGVRFTPSVLQAAGLNLKEIYIRSLIAGLSFHAYQQVSYMILARVSPVTHSVGNCVKRVVVIVTSVLFFRTKVTPVNALGTSVALAGVFLYSRVKRIKHKAA